SQVSSLNAWIRKTAATLNLPLIDVFALTADAANGNYKSGYSLDGIHPSGVAQRVIATQALADLASVFPAAHHPLLPYTNGDPNNLVSNALMQNSSGGI